MKNYTIGYHKLKKAVIEGFDLKEDGSLVLQEHASTHRIALRRLNAVEEDCTWGRLHVECVLEKDSILEIYASAGNEEQSSVKRWDAHFVNQTDVVLYSLKGRYLWLFLEIQNAPSGSIRRIRVQNPGDHFLQTFPEIYQDKGGVFHRYLSIFSTLHQEFQEKADRLMGLVDIQMIPEKRLPGIGEWMGLDCGDGVLSGEALRRLMKEAYRLNRMKGTRKAITKIAFLLVGEEPAVIEKVDGNVYLLFQKEIPEELEIRLLFFLMQFKPAKVKISIFSYQDDMGVDEFCYADVNAVLWVAPCGRLDKEYALEKSMLL